MIRAPDIWDDTHFFNQLKEQGIILSGEQIDFIRQIDGTAKVTAPGGSGKSLMLVLKVAYLIGVIGVKPESILVITYTKNAAQELKDRLRQYVSHSNVSASTIHSFCYKILSANGGERYKNLSKRIKNDSFRIKLLKRVLKKLGLTDLYKPQDLLIMISKAKSIMKSDFEGDYGRIFSLYSEMMNKKGGMDFEDLIIHTIELLLSNTLLLEGLKSTYKHIFFDEIQDTSPLEYRLVQLISQPSGSLCVLGDMMQSIFNFRGGDISIIRDFAKHYPNTREYFFATNHRSTSGIVQLCNSFTDRTSVAVRDNGHSPQFVMVSDIYNEAKFVLSVIRQSKRKYSDFAVLYRSSNIKQPVWAALVQSNIPFRCKDNDEGLYNLYHSRILIAHLSLIVDPCDYKAFSAILPLLNISRTPCVSTDMPLLRQLMISPGMSGEQKELVSARLKAFENCSDLTTTEALRIIRTEGGLDDVYYKSILTDESIFEDWDYIEKEANAYDRISDFLSYVDEVSKVSSSTDSNAVTLSTIHAAKGLSYPVVFLIGAVEGVIPHRLALEPKPSCFTNNVEELIEEEKRIMYVALSRAEDELYITAPRQRFGKQHMVSRFLEAFFNAQK